MPVDPTALQDAVTGAVAAQNTVLADQSDLAAKNKALEGAQSSVTAAQSQLGSDSAARDAAFAAVVDALNALKNPPAPPQPGPQPDQPLKSFRNRPLRGESMTVGNAQACQNLPPARGLSGGFFDGVSGLVRKVVAEVRSLVPGGLTIDQVIHISEIVIEDVRAGKTDWKAIVADVAAALLGSQDGVRTRETG